MTSVLLVGECDDSGSLGQPALQAITAANRLTDPEITVVIVGDLPPSVSSLPVGLVLGIPKVDESDIGIYEQATTDIFQIINRVHPDVVLFNKSDFGSLVAPRVAFRLGVVFASDCMEISNVDGSIVVTRPVFGGSALADFEVATTQSVITLRPGSFSASTETGNPSVEEFISDVTVDQRASVLDTIEESREGVRLEDANVIVSGGRGLGGPEPFSVLHDLANVLEGAVGASRAACDAGWIDHAYQVGLTGKSVTPDLYIAVGISGASQHMAGCSSSRAIVAINKDADSNIFKEARYGVVGDWEKVLPAFLSAVRDIKS
ncbi:MAG: electron transfer flavoprotein subunit alpha/FixB family protein [SAR202 cluster bacterium]|nr:MAG: electron transfer flavoprotein subunit alpha/FixB family protein [SAR202 cluster bacterium]MBF05659.1 electron transfer flavoprotein subunit alpha [Chloroflexota bacterium]MCH2530448.1 electron transfer flavoprotein subunit alpha/FixB family protein [Dehalococcoidia bacterium]KAA1300827.1 MAG: electron transfer flavoprotein subunit alpha/FixB family protein [SAR202 cluster bacterium]KAA1303403.1 MAG: electron transfer flavoprotein subunit alpha/FixB family protein [SAR202 cluster bacter